MKPRYLVAFFFCLATAIAAQTPPQAAREYTAAHRAELVRQLQQMNERLATKTDPVAGSESVFIGQIHSGEIFNQYPHECMLEGTRRWLPT